MLTPKLTWASKSQVRFLKGSGARVEGPVGSAAILKGIVEEAIPGGVETGMNRLAAAMEEWAKQNAPWTDRTGNARKGLYGFAGGTHGGEEGKGAYYAGVSHGDDIDYGIWLEVRWNGRYSIIDKTQAAFAARAGAIVNEELSFELAGRGSKFRHKGTGRFARGV